MKVIFLDIDGVLNSLRSCLALGGRPHSARDWHLFDQVAVGLLRRAIEETGAVCVLSSSWRVDIDRAPGGLTALGECLGVPFIGVTRRSRGQECRGHEIRDWLAAHEDVQNWAILDDSSDMLPEQMSHLVHVDLREGFSLANYRHLVAVLRDDLITRGVIQSETIFVV